MSMLAPRLILLHKQATSGRVRFLCLPQGVVIPAALPEGAVLCGEDFRPPVNPHPAAPVIQAAADLGLDADDIAPEAEFCVWVETSAGRLPVLLGLFATLDPPFAAAEAAGGKFIALTEARTCTEIEKQLLRLAYEHVLG